MQHLRIKMLVQRPRRDLAPTYRNYVRKLAQKALLLAGGVGAKRAWPIVNKYLTRKRQRVGNKSIAMKRDGRNGRLVYKRRRTIVRRRLPLYKKVNRLERSLASKTAEVWCRDYAPGQVLATSNQCTYLETNGITGGRIDAFLAQAKFYQTSTSTVVEKDISNLNVAGKYRIKQIYCEMVARNNAQIPIDCEIYYLKCIEKSGTFAAELALGDEEYNVTDVTTNWRFHLFEFPHMRVKFKILAKGKARLNGGDELKVTSTKGKSYHDPEEDDNQASTYTKGDTIWVIRLQGVIAHAAAASGTVGLGDGGIDFVKRNKWKVEYNSNIPFRYYVTDGSFSSALTNAEVAAPNVDDVKDEL